MAGHPGRAGAAAHALVVEVSKLVSGIAHGPGRQRRIWKQHNSVPCHYKYHLSGCRDSYCIDKTVMRQAYLYNANSYIDKTTSIC